MEKVSANVTLSISKNSSSKSQTNSKLNVKVRFVWNGVPVFQFNDVFAMVNGEKMYYDNLNTLFTCTYNGSNGTQKTYKYYLKRNEAGNTGTDVKFPIYVYMYPYMCILFSKNLNLKITICTLISLLLYFYFHKHL